MNGITADFNSSRVGPKKVTASDFLTALFAPYYATGHQGFMEIRLIGGRGVKSYFFGRLDTLCRRRFESQNVHTYYGILPRERREGRKDAVKWLLALWADLDAKNFPNGKEGAWEALSKFELAPSAIVDSGHGLQALWFLKEPLAIQEVNQVEGALSGLAKTLGGDPAVCEIARVFRLPESFNVKDPGSPIPVKVKHLTPRRRYAFSDFEKFCIPIAPHDQAGEGIKAEASDGIEKVLACKFIRYAEANARELSEPLWWSALTNLLPFKGGHEKAHDLSRPYEKGWHRYSVKETERKIKHILKTSPGPHTCQKIVQHGYPCSFVGRCQVDAPAGLAWEDDAFIERLRQEPWEIGGDTQ
ncbi:MAG: hypothetical protein A2Z83_09100 [Omnitrophica bacterium GWA2_52_8]|nr:MAG: hypothetical protein A2Z83_09100 [Omnitrophica bacterium GWA2_52_8]